MAGLNTVRYAEPDYWEARYQREPALFEWFFGHTALRRVIRTFISKKKPVLHIGCGTSNLQEGMARSGYTIINTDISEVVIQQMQQRHSQYTNMTYRVSDCRCMPEFLDCSFGHVLDKGTMDALLCCKQGTHNVMRMLLEIYRVLQPGGSFLLITLGDPTRRLPLLCDPRLPWKVSLLLLPKISAANQAYVDGKPINDSTEPVEAQGPLEVVDADTILDLPPGVQFSNFFFAYICKKQPLQLPQHQGQKAQLPNGWVAGSKELFSKLQKEMGLPEDLLDKGRRKRVMHVPAGSHGMPVAPYPSSTTSMNSRTSSPLSMAALQSACSGGSVPAAAMGDLHCVLTALQLEQLRHHQTPSPAGEASTLSADSQRDIPARPQSAPNLVAISEADDDGPAAEAVTIAAAAGAAGGSGPLLGVAGVQAAAVQQFVPAGPSGAAAASGGCAGRAVGLYSSTGLAQSVPGPDALQESHLGAASVVGASAAGETGTAAAAGGSPALAPSSDALGGGQPPQHPGASSCGQATAGNSMPMLVHTLSSPARLSVATSSQQQLLAHAGGDQPSASTQVFNFALPAAAYAAAAAAVGGPAAAAGGSAGEEGAVLDSALLDSSPLPPTGKAKTSMASPPTSPGSTSAHALQDSQEPAAWPGLKLQQGQVLPQLQGQQAAGVSAATAAAAAAGMYPHPVAPRGARLPRLRRFSTEYGALSGSALQVQLEQLRLIQAQHSESADGLVLHDVAAGDSCSSSAAAAAAVAAAAWGTVRRPRDRRLSNISILSGLSIMSSTSIDESGEDLVCEGPCSTAGTAICSSEPSCQLCSSTAHGATTHEPSTGGNPQGAHATPSSSQ